MVQLLTDEQIKVFKKVYPAALKESFSQLLQAYRTDDINLLVDNEDPSQRSQQISSMISPLNEQVLKAISSSINTDWVMKGGLNHDSKFNGILIEHKFGVGLNNKWTGHHYSNKTDYHLLMKADISGKTINRLFMCILNLNECSEFTQWPKTVYEKSSYSTLKIHVSDIPKAQFVFGNLIPCRKWCKIEFEAV